MLLSKYVYQWCGQILIPGTCQATCFRQPAPRSDLQDICPKQLCNASTASNTSLQTLHNPDGLRWCSHSNETGIRRALAAASLLSGATSQDLPAPPTPPPHCIITNTRTATIIITSIATIISISLPSAASQLAQPRRNHIIVSTILNQPQEQANDSQ